MSKVIDTRGDVPTLTDEQRGKFLEALSQDKTMGLIAALRYAGVPGKRGVLRQLLDDELMEQAREARGWNINRVEGVAWEVATNPEHPAWDRANARILKAYHPAFRDATHLEVTGGAGGPVEVKVEHDHQSAARLLRKLADVGLIQPGPAAALDPPAKPVLPPPSD